LVLATRPSAKQGAPPGGLHVSPTGICFLEGPLYNASDLFRGSGLESRPEQLLSEAWAREGESVLNRLRGDYCTLLWTRQARRGIVVADQLGARSPSWARLGADVVVASDLPWLLSALPRRPAPDAVAMAHWLARSVPPGGRTLFDGVRRLPG